MKKITISEETFNKFFDDKKVFRQEQLSAWTAMLFQEDETFGNEWLANQLNISERHAGRTISALLEKGLIQRVGVGKYKLVVEI